MPFECQNFGGNDFVFLNFFSERRALKVQSWHSPTLIIIQADI